MNTIAAVFSITFGVILMYCGAMIWCDSYDGEEFNPEPKPLNDPRLAARRQAETELAEENFRALVEREKQRIREHRPLLHKLFPFTITIRRR